MDPIYSLSAQSNERAQKIAEIIIKAAKETHAVVSRSEALSQQARNSIATHDKAAMWLTLQQYIARYADFIKSISAFTGVVLYRVDRAFYETVTATDIETQLQIMIGFIYAKEACNSAAKEAFRQCLKKLLKRSGLFTDKELRLLPL